MTERPRILSLSDFTPPDICDRIIARSRPQRERAAVYDPSTGLGRIESARSNSAFVLDPAATDLVLVVLRYGVGETFDWHVDYLDPAIPGQASDLAARGQRIATLLLYLKDDFDGGETAFETGSIRHRARRGDALMWANTLPQGGIDLATRHAGLPPTRGEKWVLSQWMRPAPRA